MTSAEKMAEDEAKRTSKAKAIDRGRFIAASEFKLESLGPGVMNEISDEQWQSWRAMPQTKRIVGWVAESLGSHREELEAALSAALKSVKAGHDVTSIQTEYARKDGAATMLYMLLELIARARATEANRE